MHRSPLQLERHFFTKVEICSNANGKVGVSHALHCETEIGQAADDPKRFQVTLLIKMGRPKEDEVPTYTGEIQAVGLFRVADEWPQDQIHNLVEVNGQAILFGAIREMVLTITSRGPFPPILLNSFTFIRENGSEKDPSSKVEVLAK